MGFSEMIKSDKERLDKLEAWAKFHDVTDKQVIGLHYDVGLLKSRVNANSTALNELKNVSADFARDTHQIFVKLGAFHTSKQNIKMNAHWLSCAGWVSFGVLVGLLIARYV